MTNEEFTPDEANAGWQLYMKLMQWEIDHPGVAIWDQENPVLTSDGLAVYPLLEAVKARLEIEMPGVVELTRRMAEQ